MKLLDLFCGQGGASVGYSRAGFNVTGVDIAPQALYPFEFVQADALEVLADVAFLGSFDAVHASPPCQAYSPLNGYNRRTYPDLVAPVRHGLQASGVLYVIENVVQAPLIDPTVLCGPMFGGRYYRHRGFESNVPLSQPSHPRHAARCARAGCLPKCGEYMSIHGGKHSRAWLVEAAITLGVPWMVGDDTAVSTRGVCESIPPAYSEFIGGGLLAAVAGR